jgi:hypothetical protein
MINRVQPQFSGGRFDQQLDDTVLPPKPLAAACGLLVHTTGSSPEPG